MKNKNNVIDFTEMKKRKDEGVGKDTKVQTYQLTVQDTIGFLRVLNLMRNVSFDGEIVINVTDDNISITRSSLLLTHDFEINDEIEFMTESMVETLAEMSTTERTTASFNVMWDLMGQEEAEGLPPNFVENVSGSMLCEALILLATSDYIPDLPVLEEQPETDE